MARREPAGNDPSRLSARVKRLDGDAVIGSERSEVNGTPFKAAVTSACQSLSFAVGKARARDKSLISVNL